MKKKNTGITLVALVITIIVLIILAGVSINSVMNGGLIENAKSARDDFSKTAESEVKGIDSLTLKTDLLMAQANTGNAGGTSESTLMVGSGILAGIKKGTTVSELEEMLPDGYSVLKADGRSFDDEEKDENGKTEKERTIAGTGMQIVKNGVDVSRVVIYGDVDGNGTVTITDSSRVLSEALTNYQKVAGDVNGDGYLDCDDSNIIATEFGTSGTINQLVEPIDGANIRKRSNPEWIESKAQKIAALPENNVIKTEWTYDEAGNPSIFEMYLGRDAIVAVSDVENVVKGSCTYWVNIYDANSNFMFDGNIVNGCTLEFSDDINCDNLKIKFIIE